MHIANYQLHRENCKHRHLMTDYFLHLLQGPKTIQSAHKQKKIKLNGKPLPGTSSQLAMNMTKSRERTPSLNTM
jgi:hypothetical protein